MMSAKERMTRQQLRNAIMQEVRQHPEWNDILDVAITQPVQAALHHPNWDTHSLWMVPWLRRNLRLD
jgi:hypothetical protein